jgi:DNA polymerase-3 subunit beta
MNAAAKTRAGAVVFTVDAAKFSQRLSHVAGIVERRNTIPILGCVHIEAGRGGVSITATNLDQWARARVEAQPGINAGAFCVEAARLSEMVKRMSGTLEIIVAGGVAKINAGRAKGEIPTLPADDFPPMAFASEAVRWGFKAAPLARALGSVAYACSAEETRYYLRGVHMRQVKDGLRLEATDGYRVATATLSEGVASDLSFEPVILPRESAAYAGALCLRAGDEVAFAIDGNKAFFEAGGETFITKLIDGSFPDVDRVFPGGKGIKHTLPAADLIRAIDFAMSGGDFKSRAVSFDFEKGRLVFSARVESNYSETVVEAEGVREAEGFVLNGRFFLEALAPFKDGDVTFYTFGPAMPIRIDGGADGLRQVIMVFRG